MSDNIIVDTATRIFSDLCEPQTVNAAEEGHWPAELWNALEESGLTLTWVPDNLGGAGAEMLDGFAVLRSEEHTSELQSPMYLVCRLLLEKKKKKTTQA